MRYLILTGMLALITGFGLPLCAQGGVPGGAGGGGAGQGGGGGGAGQGRGRFPGRQPDMRRERDDRRPPGQGQGGAQGPGRDQGDRIGWGESGTDERILPGQTVSEADKNTRLEAEADKLALEDRRLRRDFIKFARIAWQKSEREDRRYYAAWKRVNSDEERLAKEKEKHKEELDAAWKECDDKLLKDEILSEEQLEAFQASTADLRTETATDKSHRQDEIRARRIEEIRERANALRRPPGSGDNEDKEKKEKKEEEDE